MAVKHKVRTKKTILVQVTSDAETKAQWVKSMQIHFHENGFYRAEDLTRLVGDPRKSVSGSFPEGEVALCASTKA